MIICVTSKEGNIDAEMDMRFGRCNYFIIGDTETMKFQPVENNNVNATGGAGIKTAEAIAKKGVKVVITGNIGPNAFDTLKAADIHVVTGANGIIRQVINDYKNGKYEENTAPSVSSHHGMK